jgi:hypothetical protein
MRCKCVLHIAYYAYFLIRFADGVFKLRNTMKVRNFLKQHFKVKIMNENDLSKFFQPFNFFMKMLILPIKKIANISKTSVSICDNTYITALNDVVQVFKNIIIDNVVSMNIYENSSFSSTLVVFSNGEFKDWLTLKLSKIKNSGFGVYSACSFQKNEFITCYLGEVDENPADDTYVFKKINGSPEIHRSGLKEDYWFGH